MAREHPAYRDNLERLNEFFPDSELFTRAELMKFTKRDRQTVVNIFPFEGKYITKVNFARMLARMGE